MQNSGKPDTILRLIDQYCNGNRRALSRIISLVENQDTLAQQVWERIYPLVGNATRIGITGPPGAGKSSLVDQLSKLYRAREQKVGIIAVDPTSPFTGGALLGDRIRMNDLATDPGVFIRSMATRGSLGGLSRHAQEVADLYDGFGFDIVLFETVGVGQSELDIVQAADTTVVVLVPETGDTIQAMKAGLMEIADIFVINKSDRPGAERMMLEIQTSLDLRTDQSGWTPPIVQTVANSGDGVTDLLDTVAVFQNYQRSNGQQVDRRQQRLAAYTKQMIDDAVMQKFWQPEVVEELEQALQEDLSPYKICQKLLKDIEVSHNESK